MSLDMEMTVVPSRRPTNAPQSHDLARWETVPIENWANLGFATMLKSN